MTKKINLKGQRRFVLIQTKQEVVDEGITLFQEDDILPFAYARNLQLRLTLDDGDNIYTANIDSERLEDLLEITELTSLDDALNYLQMQHMIKGYSEDIQDLKQVIIDMYPEASESTEVESDEGTLDTPRLKW